MGALVAKFGKREKGKAAKHASALTRGATPAATVAPELADAFEIGGMPGVQFVPVLSEVPLPATPAGAAEIARNASATDK